MMTPPEIASEQSADDVVFTVTTENAAGRVNRLTGRILFGLLTLFFVGGGLYLVFGVPLRGDDLWVRYTYAVICFLIGPLFFIIERFAPRGTWHLDGDGVEFVPIDGENEFLTWDEIDAVNWGRMVVGLRGGSQKIVPHFQYMDAPEREAVLAFIKAQLKNEFDLRFMPATKITVKRWMLIFAVAILVTAIIMGWLLVFAFFIQPNFVQWGVRREIGVIIVFLPFLVPIAMLHWTNRKLPVWRERHQRYAIFDEPTT